jgi:hypothetical protein
MFVPQRLSLGELIEAIEKHKPEDSVRFDFGACAPDELMSYRGYYHDLAVGFSHGAQRGPTVAEFVKQLKSAIGDTFTGYKGGEFVMNEHSRIWVANRGDSTDTAIFGVTGDWEAVILTGYCP